MSPESRTPRVLIVEDHDLTRVVLVALAQPMCEVTAVADATAALRALASHPVDVVLSDHDLGTGMNGEILLGEVARRWPGVRRYLMSATERTSAHSFLAKPIGTAQFADMVEACRRAP